MNILNRTILRRFTRSCVLVPALGTLLVGSFGCNDEPEPGTSLESALVGQWRSAECESYPDGMGGENHLLRSFELDGETWHLDLDLFADAGCSTPLFSVEIDGTYALLDPSEEVVEATEANFSYDSIVWTAHLDDMAEVFTGAGCGDGPWSVGVPQDVSDSGCIGFAHPVNECPTDHDIVSVEGDELFFGQRVTNMCEVEGRPTALNAYPVVRQWR